MHWEAKAGGEQIREGAELATMEYGWEMDGRWWGMCKGEGYSTRRRDGRRGKVVVRVQRVMSWQARRTRDPAFQIWMMHYLFKFSYKLIILHKFENLIT
jgi:hypothetical protein